jgi:hypothetical protein
MVIADVSSLGFLLLWSVIGSAVGELVLSRGVNLDSSHCRLALKSLRAVVSEQAVIHLALSMFVVSSV